MCSWPNQQKGNPIRLEVAVRCSQKFTNHSKLRKMGPTPSVWRTSLSASTRGSMEREKKTVWMLTHGGNRILVLLDLSCSSVNIGLPDRRDLRDPTSKEICDVRVDQQWLTRRSCVKHPGRDLVSCLPSDPRKSDNSMKGFPSTRPIFPYLQ